MTDSKLTVVWLVLWVVDGCIYFFKVVVVLYKEAKTCNEKLESIEAKEERRVLALDTLIALKK